MLTRLGSVDHLLGDAQHVHGAQRITGPDALADGQVLARSIDADRGRGGRAPGLGRLERRGRREIMPDSPIRAVPAFCGATGPIARGCVGGRPTGTPAGRATQADAPGSFADLELAEAGGAKLGDQGRQQFTGQTFDGGVVDRAFVGAARGSAGVR